MADGRMLSHPVLSTDFKPTSIEQGVMNDFMLYHLLYQWTMVSVTTHRAVKINKG